MAQRTLEEAEAEIRRLTNENTQLKNGRYVQILIMRPFNYCKIQHYCLQWTTIC
jgi:hypothetical protein